MIPSYLAGKDVKNLRLVCKLFSELPFISRVFISAHPKDIEVFRCIADHEAFRRGVKEIIWDEARFKDPRTTRDKCDGYDEAPSGYRNACTWNLNEIRDRRSAFYVEFPSEKAINEKVKAHMPLLESWPLYEEYLAQQDAVLEDDGDIKAFEYGLKRFTTLKRITLTPAAHGFIFNPLYETPMVRSLPYGFNYPIPRGWPGAHAFVYNPPWNHKQWRGFRQVIRCLAENKGPSVTELCLDAHQLQTGLTSLFFDSANERNVVDPCEDYDNLVSVLRRPGFRRLDLALILAGQQMGEWKSLRNGRIRHVLAESSEDLEHIHLGTDLWDVLRLDTCKEDSSTLLRHFTPLRDIFPIERWPKLRHFGLSKFYVRQDDLLPLLAALPDTIRTVELSFLYFLDKDQGGGYRSLLSEMRDTLDWSTRDVAARPRVKIGSDDMITGCYGRALWFEGEVDSFLYEGGPNPFSFGRQHVSDLDVGTIRDKFQPEIDGPWVDCPCFDRMDLELRPLVEGERDYSNLDAAIETLEADSPIWQ